MGEDKLSEEKHENKKILFVDDNHDNRFLINEYMKSTKHRVTFAVDGMDAVEKFKDNSFDMVFMDLRMPRMDGYEATRQILTMQKERGLSKTNIIAMTAHVLKNETEEAIKVGCKEVLNKPIFKKQLFKTIEKFS